MRLDVSWMVSRMLFMPSMVRRTASPTSSAPRPRTHSIDAGREAEWRRVNRPHGRLRLTEVLGGVCAFAESRRGTLVTETMLVAGVNDALDHLRELALVLQTLEPDIAYVAVPTRPPAEPWVEPPPADRLVTAWAMLRDQSRWRPPASACAAA